MAKEPKPKFYSAELTKLRILQKQAAVKLRLAEQTRDRIIEEAEQSVYEKRREWEKVLLKYLDEAERQGLCRFCLKPLNEGTHDGVDHIAMAVAI
jgi:hypothetical protein